MQDEFLLGVAACVGIKFLGVFACAQSGERDGLGFTTGKNGGTMCAWENSGFAPDGANRIHGAPIQTLALIKNQRADIFLLEIILDILANKFSHFFRTKLFHQLVTHFFENGAACGFAGELTRSEQSGNNAVTSQSLGFLKNFLGDDVYSDLALGFPDQFHELFLGFNQGLAGFMTKLQGCIEISLGDFLRGTFIHHDILGVADINQIQIALSHLDVAWVGDELTFDASNTNSTQGTIPGDVADGQCCGSTNDAQDIRIIFTVGAQHNGLNLHFIIPTLGEQGTNGAVGQAAGEDFFFRGTTFALEISAGKFSSGSGFFTIIHRQGEKFLSGFRLGGGNGCNQNNGFTELNGNGSVCLFG